MGPPITSELGLDEESAEILSCQPLPARLTMFSMSQRWAAKRRVVNGKSPGETVDIKR